MRFTAFPQYARSCVTVPIITVTNSSFLGALAELRKARIGFVMSAVRLSVRPHGTARPQFDGFP